MKSRSLFAEFLPSSLLVLMFLVLSAPAAFSQIAVTQAIPPVGEQGKVNMNVTVKGKGFKRGALAKFLVTGTSDTGGVTVNSTTFVSSSELTANIDISPDAVLSKFDIQVRNSDGRTGKGIELFKVQQTGACSLPAPIVTGETCSSPGAPGCLDTTFATSGISVSDSPGTGEEIAIQADGKIVVTGTIDNENGLDFTIRRYTTDGAVDSGFGDNGMVNLPDHGAAKAVVIQPDGKIVVAGQGMWVVRLDPDGSLDTTFGTGGKTLLFAGFGSDAEDLALQSDGKIVIVGTGKKYAVGTVGGRRSQENAWHIARLTASGVADSTFRGTGLIAIDGSGAKGVAIQRVKVGTTEEERIVVAGRNLDVMRFNPDGSADATFGSSGTGTAVANPCGTTYVVTGIAIDSANGIVLTGTAAFGSDRAILVARFTEGGTLDTSFGGMGTGAVFVDIFGGGPNNTASYDVAEAPVIQNDGKIVASIGYATTWDGRWYAGVVRYKPDGTLDPTFGMGGAAVLTVPGSAHGIAVQPGDGKIVQTGYAGISGVEYCRVIRYLP